MRRITALPEKSLNEGLFWSTALFFGQIQRECKTPQLKIFYQCAFGTSERPSMSSQ
jgi:hypothetical protein